MKMNSRVSWMDFVRVFGSICVIAIHICERFFYRMPVHSATWLLTNCVDSFARVGVPLFIMLSGAIFLNANRETPISYYIRKSNRILKIFIIWSCIYVMYGVLTGDILSSFSTVGTKIILGHYHMWYLLMIIGIYLITPILKSSFVYAEKNETYFMMLALFFAIILPWVLNVCKAASAIIPVLSNLEYATEVSIGKLELNFGFTFYYVAGHYLSKKHTCKEKRCIVFVAGALGYLATTVLTFCLYRITGEVNEVFYSYNSPTVMLTAIATFILLKEHASSVKYEFVIGKIAKYSTGVYLIHIIVIDLLFKYIIGSYSNALVIVMAIPFVVVTTYVMVTILSFVPGVKEMF